MSLSTEQGVCDIAHSFQSSESDNCFPNSLHRLPVSDDVNVNYIGAGIKTQVPYMLDDHDQGVRHATQPPCAQPLITEYEPSASLTHSPVARR